MVANAVAETHPRQAANLYLLTAQTLIDQRGRERYAEAAIYLGQIRQIYQRLGEVQPWQTFIARLRDENRNLRALQDELNRAGL